MKARKKAELQRVTGFTHLQQAIRTCKTSQGFAGHRQAETPRRDAMSKVENAAADDYVRVNPVF
jgi:hypothetical protein